MAHEGARNDDKRRPECKVGFPCCTEEKIQVVQCENSLSRPSRVALHNRHGQQRKRAGSCRDQLGNAVHITTGRGCSACMRWPLCQDALTISPTQQARSLAWLAKSSASLDAGRETDLAASSAADLDRGRLVWRRKSRKWHPWRFGFCPFVLFG